MPEKIYSLEIVFKELTISDNGRGTITDRDVIWKELKDKEKYEQIKKILGKD